jgi:hypothetical protein
MDAEAAARRSRHLPRWQFGLRTLFAWTAFICLWLGLALTAGVPIPLAIVLSLWILVVAIARAALGGRTALVISCTVGTLWCSFAAYGLPVFYYFLIGPGLGFAVGCVVARFGQKKGRERRDYEDGNFP